MTYTTHQLLQGIFAKLPDNYSFQMNPQEFQNFFYDLQRQNNPLARNIPFDTDGISPSSIALSEGMDLFLTSGLINFMIPDLNPYVINTEAMRIGFERYCKKEFNAQELSELEKLAQAFQQKFTKFSIQ